MSLYIIPYQPNQEEQKRCFLLFRKKWGLEKKEFDVLENVVMGVPIGTTDRHASWAWEMVEIMSTNPDLREEKRLVAGIKLIFLEFLKRHKRIGIKNKYRQASYRWFMIILDDLDRCRDQSLFPCLKNTGCYAPDTCGGSHTSCPLGDSCLNSGNCLHVYVRNRESEQMWRIDNINRAITQISEESDFLIRDDHIICVGYLQDVSRPMVSRYLSPKDVSLKDDEKKRLDLSDEEIDENRHITIMCKDGKELKIDVSLKETSSVFAAMLIGYPGPTDGTEAKDDTKPIFPYNSDIIERSLLIEEGMNIGDNNHWTILDILAVAQFAFWFELKKILKVIETIVKEEAKTATPDSLLFLAGLLFSVSYNKDNIAHKTLFNTIQKDWKTLEKIERFPIDLVEAIYREKDLTQLSWNKVISLSHALTKRRGSLLLENIDRYLRKNINHIVQVENFPSIDAKCVRSLITKGLIKRASASGKMNILKFLTKSESKSNETLITVCISRIFTAETLCLLSKSHLMEALNIAISSDLELVAIDLIVPWSFDNRNIEVCFMKKLFQQTDASTSEVMKRTEACFSRIEDTVFLKETVLVKAKGEWVEGKVQKTLYKIELSSGKFIIANLENIAPLGSKYLRSNTMIDGKDKMYDALDIDERWCKVKVMERRPGAILIHYLDVATKWDKWLPITSKRLAKYKSMTQERSNEVNTPEKQEDMYDVQDINGNWTKGEVVDRKNDQLRIHFIGWSKTWDEWINENSDKKQPYKSKTEDRYTGDEFHRDLSDEDKIIQQIYCECHGCQKERRHNDKWDDGTWFHKNIKE